jgi:aspartate aminotransferase
MSDAAGTSLSSGVAHMNRDPALGAEPLLDRRVVGIGISPTLGSRDRVERMAAAGRPVSRFGLGQSPFPVPALVVEALRAHAPEKDYLPVRGLKALRAAVAAYHQARHGVARTSDDIVVGPGSKELMFLLKLCYAAEVIVPAPAWVSHAPQARLASRPVRWLPVRPEDDLRVTADVLDAVCRAGGERRRLLILNYPNNPTGATYTADALAELGDVCARRGVVVLSDEIYGELDFEARHVSLARFHPRGTIISSGLSKWCGAGGWRLGVFSMPPELRELGDAIAAVGSETYSSTSAPIQFAGVRAFQLGEELERYLALARRIMAGVARFAAAELRAAGARVIEPAGGFYVFPDLGDLAPALARARVVDDVALAERVLEETGVSALPGSSFGMPAGSFYLRLALVDFDGARAMASCGEVVGEPFIAAHCPAVHRGVRALADWMRALR